MLSDDDDEADLPDSLKITIPTRRPMVSPSGRRPGTLDRHRERPPELMGVAHATPLEPLYSTDLPSSALRRPAGSSCRNVKSSRLTTSASKPKLKSGEGGSQSVVQRLDSVQQQLRSLSEVVCDISQQHSKEVADAGLLVATQFPEVRRTRLSGVESQFTSLEAVNAEVAALAQHSIARSIRSGAVEDLGSGQSRCPSLRSRRGKAISDLGENLTEFDLQLGVDSMALVTYGGAAGEGRSLLVHIFGATGLSEAGLSRDGFADLYCTCEIPGKKNSKFATSICLNSLSPEWNDSVEVARFSRGDELEFTVWDKDPWDKDHFVGKALVTYNMLKMQQADGEGGFQGDLTLEGTPGIGSTAALSVKVDVLETRYDQDVPAERQLWPVWRSRDCANGRESSVTTYMRTMMDELRKSRISMSTQSDLPSQPHLPRCTRCRHLAKFVRKNLMVKPGSWKNMLWQLPGGLLILFDVVMIPLQLFEMPDLLLNTVQAWSSVVYWSFDVLHNFFVCYEDMGQVVSSPRKVAIHYAKTWLIPDVVIVCMDWVLILHEMKGFGSRSWRSAKILRSLRVIRSFKAYNVAITFMDRVQSQWVVVLLKLLSLVFSVFLTAHYVCCYWFAIGDRNFPGMDSFDLQTTWLSELGVPRDKTGQLYLYAMQWTLSQSGMSSWSPISPTNGVEIVWNQIVIMMWMLIIAGTASSFTIWAIQVRDTQLDYERQEARLRRYLLENRISKSVGNAAVRFVRVNFETLQSGVNEASIPMFNDLPLILRLELHRQIYLPMLRSHLVFEQMHEDMLDAVCHLACIDASYLAGHQVFDKGDPAKGMFFLKTGEFAYCSNHEAEPLKIKGESWVAEIAVWRRWAHVGSLAARMSSTAVIIDVERFNAIMTQYARSGADLDDYREYARMVAQHFSGCTASDIWTEEGLLEVLEGVFGWTLESMETHSPRGMRTAATGLARRTSITRAPTRRNSVNSRSKMPLPMAAMLATMLPGGTSKTPLSRANILPGETSK